MNDDEIKVVFSNNLKRYMALHNLNQNDIAKITGVSQQSVSNWLNNRLMPRMGVIEKLANHFNILKSDLLEDKNNVSDKYHTKIIQDLELSSWMGTLLNNDDEDLYKLLKIISKLDSDKIKTLLVMAEALDK